jgi:hypothetical protein
MPDLTSHLANKRQALRDQFAIRPLSPEECRRQEDVRWAQLDPEVQAQYRGQFVVPFGRRIIAHGLDAAAVLAEAALATGCRVEQLALVGIVDPLQDIPQ